MNRNRKKETYTPRPPRQVEKPSMLDPYHGVTNQSFPQKHTGQEDNTHKVRLLDPSMAKANPVPLDHNVPPSFHIQQGQHQIYSQQGFPTQQFHSQTFNGQSQLFNPQQGLNPQTQVYSQQGFNTQIQAQQGYNSQVLNQAQSQMPIAPSPLIQQSWAPTTVQNQIPITQIKSDPKPKEIKEEKPKEELPVEIKLPTALVHYSIVGGKGWQRLFGHGRGSDIQPIQIIKPATLYGISFSHSGIGSIAAGPILICKNVKDEIAPTLEASVVLGVLHIKSELLTPLNITLLSGEAQGTISWESKSVKLERNDCISFYCENLSGANIEVYILYT